MGLHSLPFWGAGIETACRTWGCLLPQGVPARTRGLKLLSPLQEVGVVACRARAGAWVETSHPTTQGHWLSRTLFGCVNLNEFVVDPYRLKKCRAAAIAWIETGSCGRGSSLLPSRPVHSARGLKHVSATRRRQVA